MWTYRWLEMLESGAVESMKELAEYERVDPSLVSRLINLTTLAPEIVQALLERETLNREDFLSVMNGQPLEPMAKGTPPPLENPQRELERSPKQAGIPPRLEPGPA